MKSLLSVLLVMASVTLGVDVAAQTSKFEGVAAIAAGSINPPNPVEGCNRAKRNAEEKAVKAGTKSLSSWDRLSNDSDCSLQTTGKPGMGYYYIFTARGNFIK